jgi:hypothetical protein
MGSGRARARRQRVIPRDRLEQRGGLRMRELDLGLRITRTRAASMRIA